MSGVASRVPAPEIRANSDNLVELQFRHIRRVRLVLRSHLSITEDAGPDESRSPHT